MFAVFCPVRAARGWKLGYYPLYSIHYELACRTALVLRGEQIDATGYAFVAPKLGPVATLLEADRVLCAQVAAESGRRLRLVAGGGC